MSTNDANRSRDEPTPLKILPWLKEGRRLEKVLCFFTLASLLTVAILIAVLIGYRHRYELGNICLTEGCIEAASFMLSRLDEDIDPCDDFYEFACGKWLKTHHIPDDKSVIDTYEEAQDDLDLQLKILVETELSGTEPPFIRMAKDLYDTCMDTKSIEKAGSEPLKKVLRRLGGWPVVEGQKWDESKFDWLETVLSLRKLGYGYNTFLTLSVGINARNSSERIIDLDEGYLSTDRTYLIGGLNDSVTAAYYKKMVKVATRLGADEKTAEKELLEALQLEMTLANYSVPPEERRNASKFDNKYTIKALQKMVPQIPWIKYISSAFLPIRIYENEILNVQVPEYVKKVVDLIKRTEKRSFFTFII